MGRWSRGCQSCPEDEQGNPYPLGCFFNIEDQGWVMGQQAVESCFATCSSSLEFSNCKLCPKDVNGFDFGINPGEEECVFCPDDSVMNPQKEFRLFGEGIQCWQVQKFFDSVQVPSDAPNCHLARMMNYICGCDGPGYGGASTETKKAVLAWLPRAMAILSVLVSAKHVACRQCCELLCWWLSPVISRCLSFVGIVFYSFWFHDIKGKAWKVAPSALDCS